MKTEGAFLFEIKRSRGNKEVIKLIDIEIPDSLPEMLDQYEDIVEKLGDQKEQIYYTVGKVRRSVDKPNNREAISQKHLLVDIDHVIQDKKEEYIKIFCAHFDIERAKTGIIDSGYGLQFLIGFKKEAYKKDFDDANSAWRKQVQLLELAFAEHNLIGSFDAWNEKEKCFIQVHTHVDTTPYRPCSLARFPGTVNHAEHKKREARPVRLIQGKVEPQAESLLALMQKNLGSMDEEIEKSQFQTLKIDGEFVKSNCGFLQHFLNNPKEVHEGDFFLVVGILKHCYPTPEEGEKACLEWFHLLQKESQSPTITSANDHWAMGKIIRALPISYKKIDQLGEWSKSDPGRPKIKHPLQMRSPTFVATRDSGFHRVKEGKNGKFTMLPEYEDLRKFFEGTYSYVSCNEVCWVFNGKFYERFEKDYLRNFAQTHFNPIADTSMVQEFTNLVLRTNLIRPEDWEKNTERKVNFNNGVLDIESGVFTPHDDKKTTKQFLFKSCVPYDYDPAATAPTFDKFMDDVTRGIGEFKQNALEYFGYAIAGEPIWLAQTLLLLGPDGAGGKSTTLDIIKKVVGRGLYSTLSLEDLNDQQARAMLEGKYFNVFGELESSKYLQSKVWKSLTTGEEVTIKNVFEKPYSIKSRAKMMFASNHVPKSNDTSDAFFRRWLVIPFTRNFIEEGIVDPFIGKKLEAELPGIFNMLVEAYKRLKARGSFEIGPESRKVFEEFKNEVDPVRAWFSDRVVDLGSGDDAKEYFTAFADLFADFKQFCADENMEFGARIVTGKAFSQKILKLVKNPSIDRKKTSAGSSGSTVKGFWGLKLKLES